MISLTDTSDFPTANLKQGATMSTVELWHYGVTITDKAIAKEIAKFGPAASDGPTSDTTAAIINTLGKRQQMVFFISWAPAWSPTSAWLEHAYIHWMTRGLCKPNLPKYLYCQSRITKPEQSSASARRT